MAAHVLRQNSSQQRLYKNQHGLSKYLAEGTLLLREPPTCDNEVNLICSLLCAGALIHANLVLFNCVCSPP